MVLPLTLARQGLRSGGGTCGGLQATPPQLPPILRWAEDRYCAPHPGKDLTVCTEFLPSAALAIAVDQRFTVPVDKHSYEQFPKVTQLPLSSP